MNTREILLGELKEFKRSTTAELQEIKRDVRTLMHFKWKMMGAGLIVSFLATVLLEYVRR